MRVRLCVRAVQVIRDYQLMAVVCILVLVDVLVLTVWELVDPLLIEVSNKTMEIVVSIFTTFFLLHGPLRTGLMALCRGLPG